MEKMLSYAPFITIFTKILKNREKIYSPELLPSPGVLAFQTKEGQIITPTFIPFFVAILVINMFDLDILSQIAKN